MHSAFPAKSSYREKTSANAESSCNMLVSVSVEFFDMKESELPAIAEPWFLAFKAKLTV
jgi:hypothetical protein